MGHNLLFVCFFCFEGLEEVNGSILCGTCGKGSGVFQAFEVRGLSV